MNFSARTAVVEYERGKVSVAEMVEALRRRGYEARPLSDPPRLNPRGT